MKYILFDQTETDVFTSEFDSLDEAIKAGDSGFGYLTDADKKHRTAFYLLESCEPDKEAEYHYDGKIVREWM